MTKSFNKSYSTKQVLDAFQLHMNQPTRAIPQAACKLLTAHVIDSLIPRRLGALMYCKTLDGVDLTNCRFADAPGESMVDIAVYCGDEDPFVPIWTAESEAYDQHHLAENANSNTSGYLWDLFKLLQVSSPRRLFVMRCAGHKHELAWRLIDGIVRGYHEQFHAGDQIFSVVLPTSFADLQSVCCRGWALPSGKLKTLPESQRDMTVPPSMGRAG